MTMQDAGGGRLTTWSENRPQKIRPAPGTVWTVDFDMAMGRYVLVPAQPLMLPPKLFGEVPRMTELFLDKWENTNKKKQLSILLTGQAGSGKTIQMVDLAVKSNLPIILINKPWANERWVQFLNSIETEVVILFDEFEKVYSDTKDQEFLLTVLDGTLGLPGSLIIMTTNTDKINPYFKNRPGRIHYTRQYDRLDPELLIDYCKDSGISDENTTNIIKTASKSPSEFNFDCLRAVVGELKFEQVRVQKGRSKRDYKEIVENLNIPGVKPGSDGYEGRFEGPLADYLSDIGIISRSDIRTSVLANLPTKFRYEAARSPVDGKASRFPHTYYNSDQSIQANQLVFHKKDLYVYETNLFTIGLQLSSDTIDIISHAFENNSEDPELAKRLSIKDFEMVQFPNIMNEDDTPNSWLAMLAVKPTSLTKLTAYERLSFMSDYHLITHLEKNFPGLVERIANCRSLFDGSVVTPHFLAENFPEFQVKILFTPREDTEICKSYSSFRSL